MKAAISFVIRYIPRPILQTVSPMVMKVLSQLNKGNDVECPVCGNKYKKFLPYLLTVFCFILFGNLLGLIPFLVVPALRR